MGFFLCLFLENMKEERNEMMQYDEYEKKAIESIRAFHLPDDYIDQVIGRGEILTHYIQDILASEN